MNGIFPSIIKVFFGTREPIDEVQQRLKTRRYQAMGAFVTGFVVPAAVVLLGMIDDDLNKRAINLFASASALTTGASALLGWYWQVGSSETKAANAAQTGQGT